MIITILISPILKGGNNHPTVPISTFSIVARDQITGEIGVAVQSKFIAVGSVVPFAKAGVGAIASQAWGNVRFGPVGLDLLLRGKSSQEVVRILTEADMMREHRQLAVIGMEGNASNFTGTKCKPWAGGIVGKNFSAQGNLLAGPEVVKAMALNFESSTGVLSDRLIKALLAGQDAGGDKRGRQSAALLVVKEKLGIWWIK